MMASCSSSDHPESSHPYHADWSRSTTSLERKEGRFSLRRLLLSSRKEGLLPLPEGAHLSSSSPPPVLPTLPHMSLKLPHLAHTPDSPCASGDSMWAATLDPLPQPPVMILGLTGIPLQHPQPQSLPMSFGTMSISPTAPTSLPTMGPPITEPCHHQATETPAPGICLYRTGSSHLSLYQPSRNPSPVLNCPSPSPKVQLLAECQQAATSTTLLEPSPCELPPGSDYSIDSKSSQNPHQSYLRPPSRDMDVSWASRAAQTLLSTYDPQHPSPRSPSMESLKVPSHPPSRHTMTPINPYSHHCSALRLYEQTRFDDLPFPATWILTQAEYTELCNYFAYELPFMPTWGDTQAGNDYFMKKQQGLPAADEILQYEAERNTCLLFNELHPDTLMRTLTPYEEATIPVPQQMLDEPPVFPPWTDFGNFSYVRGGEPPGTYPPSYRPFAGADPVPPDGPPIQPPPIQWVLPHLPTPPKAPTPPVLGF